jgi:hypothetical protein
MIINVNDSILLKVRLIEQKIQNTIVGVSTSEEDILLSMSVSRLLNTVYRIWSLQLEGEYDKMHNESSSDQSPKTPDS